ncbi:MAG TPA: sucrase ferredoxin [Actinophytocola sp.]|uniref:sucrase ferredoxin n=1 Tax=Actinophytocola sp. TaxID=1872138 RepID=UPI002DBC44C4|nr:sucrase ferredoxin [Actinophytocola sp.]HEU5473819.1 sucrase ferredoxin [Actinophytocola sp.]
MDVYQALPNAGPRCSSLSRILGEPMAGTAAAAATWLCIEQPGPWGREALTESHIDTVVGHELAQRVKGTGVRIALIRRAGSHPDRHQPIPHQVYLAHTAPGRGWLERGWVADPKELLDLDFAALGNGIPSGLGTAIEDEPLLLVCTNGRRDVCCALLGRPIAAALAARHGDAVWECTHLGGHRFAPTALVLPAGYAYGRLDRDTAEPLLAPGSPVRVEHCRGRSIWSPPGQVADLAVRSATGDLDPDAVRVVDEAPAGAGRWLVELAHRNGRRWQVTVTERTAPELRSASCGAGPKAATALYATSIRDLITG